jgi:hypothetical protein
MENAIDRTVRLYDQFGILDVQCHRLFVSERPSYAAVLRKEACTGMLVARCIEVI